MSGTINKLPTHPLVVSSKDRCQNTASWEIRAKTHTHTSSQSGNTKKVGVLACDSCDSCPLRVGKANPPEKHIGNTNTWSPLRLPHAPFGPSSWCGGVCGLSGGRGSLGIFEAQCPLSVGLHLSAKRACISGEIVTWVSPCVSVLVPMFWMAVGLKGKLDGEKPKSILGFLKTRHP